MFRLIRLCLTLLVCVAAATSISAQRLPLTLDELVDPSTVLRSDDETVRFALHFFIEFESLAELFSYIDEQAGRWTFDSARDQAAFARDLLERGVESRVVSMVYELPREILVTHTAQEVAEAVQGVPTLDSGLLYEGKHWSLDSETYSEVFLHLQQRWKSAINCWSASSSTAGRVLSNWYIIDEGIELFGAEYDSTEHFWQAVKYHPDVGLPDLSALLEQVRSTSWTEWVDQLSSDQATYLTHGYAVEFLRRNLSSARLEWFAGEVARYSARYDLPVRRLQQRDPETLRFTAFEEKVLWGDLADVFHLLQFFGGLNEGRFKTPELESVLEVLSEAGFNGIYLPDYESGTVGFISPEFRQLMLEIWKVKFLDHERFREVIRSTEGTRLLHFLNDGDSPDIPISIYVGMLEEIRELALQ